MKKKETRGIIIYALGHENYYRMAENLAASIRSNGDVNICLINDDLKKLRYLYLFDQFVILKDNDYKDIAGKVVFNDATIKAYDLSPFETTIKLDADMIWLEGLDPNLLFNELQNVDLAFETTGYGWNKGNSVWADEKDIMRAYNFTENNRLYKIFGEFLYFKKTVENDKFFKTVKTIYKKPKVKCASFSNGTMTDELAFQVACMLTERYPHKDIFTPVYNTFLGYGNLSRKYPFELNGFYAYSIGGHYTPIFAANNYNVLAKHYFAKLGLSNPYQVVDKRSFLPERKHL